MQTDPSINKNNLVSQEELPEFLQEIDIVQESLNRSKNLINRQFIFPEVTIINRFSELGQVKGVCSGDFLKLLYDNGQENFKKFLEAKSGNEILYFEEEQQKFKDFYQYVDEQTQVFLNNSSLKLMKYNDLLQNKNFFIFEVKTQGKLVANIFMDNRYGQDKGSVICSWRNVDIEFYEKLFNLLQENVQQVLQWEDLET